MRWLCVQDFGFTKRGDHVVLPDDAVASPWYFIPDPEEPPPPPDDEAKGDAEPANDSPKKGKG